MQFKVTFDPARVERHGQGYRLKAGQKSHVMDEAAAPDLVIKDVEVPKTGWYRFILQVVGPRLNEFARLGVPDFPKSRIQMMRNTTHSGHWVQIGVFPLKKGKNTVTFSLPEKLTLAGLSGTWDGPMPLPEVIAKYPLKYTPKGRPRVWVNEQTLAVIRRNLKHPEYARALANVRQDAASPVKLVMKPGCEVIHQPRLLTKIKAQAFLGMIEDNAALRKEAAQTMFQYFTHLTGFPGPHIIYYINDTFLTAAAVYDWCYRELMPEQRKQMIRAYYNMAVRQEGSWPPLRQSVMFGHGNELAPGYLSFGIACFDEDPEIFRILSYQMIEQWIPMRAYEFRSNLHPQGSWYGGSRLRGDLLMNTLFKTACGKDLLGEKLYRMPFYWQMIRLPDRTHLDEGDVWGYPVSPCGYAECLLFCAAATRDPAYKGLYLAELENDRSMEGIPHMILNDPEVRAVPPFSRPLPQSWYFGPFHSTMLARTGFYNDEAIVYFMGGGKHNGNHQHSDAGAFQIWYRGSLAQDIGDYGSTYGISYDYNFNKRSISHNMLRVYDPQEKFRGGNCDNDGGSRFVTRSSSGPKDYETNPEYDYGTARSVSIGPDKMRPAYSVMASDLTNAYSKKIRHYMRLFVFLNQQKKDQPASFIVCDLVESAKPDFMKIFQVSSYYPPVITDNFIGLANPGGGCADMKLYLPQKTTITDFANEKSASNPFCNKTYELPFPGSAANFAHRMEVTPVGKQAFDTFLAHFGIRAKSAAKIAENYQDLGNVHAVRSGRFLVTLPKQDKLVNTAITLDVPQGGAEVLCVYLTPGAWNAAGHNFTVKAGENTLFLAAPAGKLVVKPGKLAGAPVYQIPAKCTPPVGFADPAGLFMDGKKLDGAPVLLQNQPMLPVTAFKAGLPEFKAGCDTVQVNGETLRMPVAPVMKDGKLYVHALTLAGLLHCTGEFDRFTMQCRLTSLPPDVPAVIKVTASSNPHKLQSKIGGAGRITNSGAWAVQNRFEFTLVFDKVRQVGSFAITFTYGKTRQFPVKIEGSRDGKAFHTLFDGTSTPDTMRSVFRWKPEELRHLRVTGKRAAESPWISINCLDFE